MKRKRHSPEQIIHQGSAGPGVELSSQNPELVMQHLRLVRCAYVPRRLRVLRQLLMEQQESLKYAVSELRRHRLCWPHLAVRLPKNVHPRTPRCARSSTGTQRVALQGAAKRGQGSGVRGLAQQGTKEWS